MPHILKKPETKLNQPEPNQSRTALKHLLEIKVQSTGFEVERILDIIEIVDQQASTDPDPNELRQLGISAIQEIALRARSERLAFEQMMDVAYRGEVMERYCAAPYTEIWQYTNEAVARHIQANPVAYVRSVQMELDNHKGNRVCLERSWGRYELTSRAGHLIEPTSVAEWSYSAKELKRPIKPGDIFLCSFNGSKKAWMYMPVSYVPICCDMPG